MGPVGQPGPAVSTSLNSLRTKSASFFRHFQDNVFNNIAHVFWCRVLMESLDREASRGLLELKVTKDPEDSQEPQDPSDCR